MTDYVKATNFAAKDALPSGDANKKVRGTEINDELTSIQTAIATKLDRASPSMTGTPLAPSPSLAADNTQIATTEWVRDLLNAYEPLGTIKAWAGSVAALPTGWALCNGTSGTLNLTDRFIAGFGGGSYGQNSTGGHTPGVADTPVTGGAQAGGVHGHGGATQLHTLTEAQMPSHVHASGSGGPFYTVTGGTNVATGPGYAITFTSNTASAGSNQGHSHLISDDGLHIHTVTGFATVPGYFALAFIQKIALL